MSDHEKVFSECPSCSNPIKLQATEAGEFAFACPSCGKNLVASVSDSLELSLAAQDTAPNLPARSANPNPAVQRRPKRSLKSQGNGGKVFNFVLLAAILCLAAVSYNHFNQDNPPASPEASVTNADDASTKAVVSAVRYEELELPEVAKTPTEFQRLRRKGMAIIVPSSLKSELQQLDAFVAHKRALGLKPVVITENDFGGGTGREAAHNIRQWLKENTEKHELLYVMFIGDPHPERGQVPMKLVSDPYQATAEEYPTDFFYVDLTGTFDHNGNGVCGEPEDYGKSNDGGMDTQWDVLVGRIPCYSVEHGGAGPSSADEILLKTMRYEQETDLRWRYKFVVSNNNPQLADILDEKGVDYMIVVGGHHGDDSEIHKGRAIDLHDMDNPDLMNFMTPGAVRIGGHGNPHTCGGLVSSDVLTNFQDDKPAVVMLGGCDVAAPEVADNLTYSLLRRGAIGAVGGTRSVTSWTAWLRGEKIGEFEDLNEVGVECLLRNCSQSFPLWQKNSNVGKWASGNMSSTALLENFYGDPSVHPYPYGSTPPYAIAISPNQLQAIPIDNEPSKTITLKVRNNSTQTLKIGLRSTQDWLSLPKSLEGPRGKTEEFQCRIDNAKIDGGGSHLAQIQFSGDAGINRVRTVQVQKSGPPKEAPEGNLPPAFNRSFVSIPPAIVAALSEADFNIMREVIFYRWLIARGQY